MERESDVEGGRPPEELAPPFGDIRTAMGLKPDEEKLVRLMEELGERQRRRPDIVVRPWWSPGPPQAGSPRVGFVLEYCPDGRQTVQLRVRSRRITVEGPAGVVEASLDLQGDRWAVNGEEAGCPELLANHVLRLADQALVEAA